MAELADRQKQLWMLIRAHADCIPMLRISRRDDCFWICDLPRRTTDFLPAKDALLEAGYSVKDNEKLRLWQIDLPKDDPIYHIITQKPAFPQKGETMLVYALWRMLAAHPSPFVQQPKALLRKIIKLPELPIAERNTAAKQAIEACAALLNRKQSLPSSAAGILAMTVLREEMK